ncbi:hypothetical protein MSSIT_0605 [Methanosarcina siciliae T4/M]|uniref:Uncharacterized protein n=1 Tax=Methanosarcina siciliae T4/M TaxID=1434120 RepID=A0A0E3P1Z9_9EURY|nr:hypothetical protein [Methanosarcina siciliae]AKB27324.1 hypothetical protein MSSIT_0605 [Methanosarcina siciliae T4/M]
MQSIEKLARDAKTGEKFKKSGRVRKRKSGRKKENYNKGIIKFRSEIIPAENGKKDFKKKENC